MPLRYRSIKSVQKFVEKLEIIVIIKPKSNVGIIIFLRPRVSARNPSK